jgi:pyrroline-5-carboxylate reductase
MVESATKLGLTELEARTLLPPTFLGTSELFCSSYTPVEIINLTACKGGATERAMRFFDQSQLGETIFKVQSSAFNRIREISDGLNQL